MLTGFACEFVLRGRPAYIVYLVALGVVVFGCYVLYLQCKKVCRYSRLWARGLPRTPGMGQCCAS